MAINSVLKDWNDIGLAYNELNRAKLPIPHTFVKSWDIWKSFKFITENSKLNSFVLDVGTHRCRILELLYLNGYTNLYGCDSASVELKRFIYPILNRKFLHFLKSLIGRGPIKLSKQDLHSTYYPSQFFDFITSLSVIEHSVVLERYFKEMSRLLRIGGYLINSTDYWHGNINTDSIQEYGGRWKIFDKKSIEDTVDLSKEFGFELIEPIDFSYKDSIIEWHDKKFTFIFFILKKIK